MINVLLVSSKYPPEYSGSGHRAHRTYKRLSKKYGIKFEVITGSVTSNESGYYEIEGASVKRIANKWGRRLALNASAGTGSRLTRRAINKILSIRDYWAEALPTYTHFLQKRKKYDLIHVFGNVNVTSAAVSYAKMTRKPVIVELVNMVDNLDQYEPLILSAFWGEGFPDHSLIVCISENLRELCLRHGYKDKQIWCRPNPIDECKFNPDLSRKSEFRNKISRFGLSDIILLHLAKFIPRKKQDFMIEVMQYLPEEYKLVLAGPLVSSGPLHKRDQDYLESIRIAILDSGLGERVLIHSDFIENPEEYIKASDVFVLPSVQEGLGTPVLEALACGIPVVTNNLPGVFDSWIENGVNGYVCNLEPKSWAEKIILAHRIEGSLRRQSASRILAIASTEAIDKQYFERLDSMVNHESLS